MSEVRESRKGERQSNKIERATRSKAKKCGGRRRRIKSEGGGGTWDKEKEKGKLRNQQSVP